MKVIMPNGEIMEAKPEYLNIFKTMEDLYNKCMDSGLTLCETIARLNKVSSDADVRCYFTARYYSDKKDFNTAIKHIDEAIRLIIDKNTIADDELNPLHKAICGLAGELYAQVDNPRKSLEYYQLYQMYGLKVPSSSHHSLLSFRSYHEYVLSDLINNEITVSRPRVMNDPFDTLLIKWGETITEDFKEKKQVPYLVESFDSYRIRSFCKLKNDIGKEMVTNIFMWSHYAGGHQGICIQYSLPKEFLCHDSKHIMNLLDVKYYDGTDNINLKSKHMNSQRGLQYKSIEWQYENEIRLISYCPEYKGNYMGIPLNKGAQIECIYFGYKCPDNVIKTIRNVLEKYSNIKYYKMKSLSENVYNLYYAPIE